MSDIRKDKQTFAIGPTEFTLGIGTALTAGVVTYVLRGGALLSALMGTMPSWRGFDPLIILATRQPGLAGTALSARSARSRRSSTTFPKQMTS